MRIVFLVIVGLLLVACAEPGPTCTAPYIQNGNTCCLDKDSDSICDKDVVKEIEGLDCELCPPKFVTQIEEVIVYKYVCENETVVDTAVECGKHVVTNAHLFSQNKEHDLSIVKTFAARPACRGIFPVAELHFAFEEMPLNVTVQIKDKPTGSYRDLGAIDGRVTLLDDSYFYVGFCDPKDCKDATDAQVPATGAALYRGKITFVDDVIYTRDRLIDPTQDGEYGKKLC